MARKTKRTQAPAQDPQSSQEEQLSELLESQRDPGASEDVNSSGKQSETMRSSDVSSGEAAGATEGKELGRVPKTSPGRKVRARAKTEAPRSEPLPQVAAADEAAAWAHVQLARHPQRPHTLDYIERIFSGFQEIHGDRYFADDPAIVCGFGFLGGSPVMVIGQQKGRDTRQKLHRNFGMPKPEGYRKALRAMHLATKFGRPILTFLDTPGAYPGIDAEERGQAEAIARNLFSMAQLQTPIIVTCIGEGGSGGALALGVGNRVLMLENAIYSVISPESCAAIVWRDSTKAELAARALKLTAQDLLHLGLVDQIVKEPGEGAHADHDAAAEMLSKVLEENLRALEQLSGPELVEDRYRKFRTMGSFFEEIADSGLAADQGV